MNPAISAARQRHYRFNRLLAKGNSQATHHRHRPAAQQLHSTFALEQLTRLAHRCSASEFVMLMAPVFGLDIALPTYVKLQTALQHGQVANPECHIVHEGFYPAEYDSGKRVLRIQGAALDYVCDNPQSNRELLEILLHEFGHHLDTVIREDLAEGGPLHRDAHHEEGIRYVRRMANTGWDGPQHVLMASYTNTEGQPVNLFVDPQSALRKILSRRPAMGPATVGLADKTREGFEATGDEHGKFSHQRIGQVLTDLGFSDHECQAVYFGNWLRDYSQLLDPKLVRGPGMAKDFPNVISREALTEIVDILATRRFADERLNDPDSFKVTPQRLGVYRPREHIDNPRVEPPAPFDLAERDADFEPWVLTGDPALEVDNKTSTKNYLWHSVDFMQDELRAAMQHGRTAEGLRRFGSALHVLEDLFAHSNFVELSLIKLGYNVLPWTSSAGGRHEKPLVTGRFGGADVIASLANPIAELIAPDESWQFIRKYPGERSETDKMLLVLFREHQDDTWLNTYESWLVARDTLREIEIVQKAQELLWAKGAPLKIIQNAYNLFINRMLTLAGGQVDEWQTLTGGDPNENGSTDPSHSQLAKDHAEHPLHEPAALLASLAIKPVAQAMLDHWNGLPDADPSTVASRFFTHPDDSYWQDQTLSDWAAGHAEQITQANSVSDLGSLHRKVFEHATQSLRTLETQGNAFVDFIQEWAPASLKDVMKKILP